MISHNELNLKTFISSLAAPDINLIKDIKIGCIAAPDMRLN